MKIKSILLSLFFPGVLAIIWPKMPSRKTTTTRPNRLLQEVPAFLNASNSELQQLRATFKLSNGQLAWGLAEPFNATALTEQFNNQTYTRGYVYVVGSRNNLTLTVQHPSFFSLIPAFNPGKARPTAFVPVAPVLNAEQLAVLSQDNYRVRVDWDNTSVQIDVAELLRHPESIKLLNNLLAFNSGSKRMDVTVMQTPAAGAEDNAQHEESTFRFDGRHALSSWANILPYLLRWIKLNRPNTIAAAEEKETNEDMLHLQTRPNPPSMSLAELTAQFRQNVFAISRLKMTNLEHSRAQQDLVGGLHLALQTFMREEPCVQTFEVFKARCEALIQTAEECFARQAGFALWRDVMRPLVNALLVVINTIGIKLGFVAEQEPFKYYSVPETHAHTLWGDSGKKHDLVDDIKNIEHVVKKLTPNGQG